MQKSSNPLLRPWKPNPGPQERFLRSGAFDVLYGGARGGGKTEAMLAAACRQATPEGILPVVLRKHPGIKHSVAYQLAAQSAANYTGIIFRRTYPELEDLIQRARRRIKTWYPGAIWKASDRSFIFPSGAVLKFRHLRNPDDWMLYQGHEYQFMGIEELTHFPQKSIVNLKASCRSSDPYLVGQFRATTNPGGPGHAWVKATYVDAAPPETIIRDAETGLTKCFIPARVWDNPILVENDPQYVRILMSLPPAERKAMLDGDWDAFDGQVFRVQRGVHIVPVSRLDAETNLKDGKIPEWWPIIMAYDWGYGKPFAAVWFTVDDYGRMWLLHEWHGVKRNPDGTPMANEGIRITDREIARGILEREASWGWIKLDDEGQIIHHQSRTISRFADPSMFNSRAIAEDMKGPPLAEVYAENGVYFLKGDNARIPGWQQLHLRLELEKISDEIETPFFFVLDTCTEWIRTVPSLVPSPGNPEDVDTEGEDHLGDATRYALMSRPYKAQKPEPEDHGWKKKNPTNAGFAFA